MDVLSEKARKLIFATSKDEDDKAPKKTVSGLIRRRYSENPFLAEEGFRVPVKNKREELTTMGPAALMVDGQQIAVAQVVKTKVVDADRFVKVFVEHLTGFYDLTPASLRLLTVLLTVLSETRHMNTDKVTLTEAIMAKTMQQHGQRPISSASYYRAINELIAAGFIAPTDTPPLFFLNPAVLFNGDRIRFVTELRREKSARRQQLEAEGTVKTQFEQDIEQVLPALEGPSEA